MRERTFKTIIGNIKSRSFTQENGVPQGSVLSVTLFLIAINTISTVLKPNGRVKFIMFANDSAIYISGPNIVVTHRLLQKTINEIHKWSLSTGFTFSQEKTEAIHFCRKRKCTRTLPLQINNQQIEYTETIKFLGVQFDSKLRWKQHIDATITKCKQNISIIRMLAHTNWGANRESLLKIYKSTILSKIDYGCQAYSSACNTYLKKLNTVQNNAIRLALGAF